MVPSAISTEPISFIPEHCEQGKRRGDVDSPDLDPGGADPAKPPINSMDEVCNRLLKSARFIVVDHLGTTDDCGSPPFCDAPHHARYCVSEDPCLGAGTAQAAGKLGMS
jgi:hypothetical protein